MNAQHSQGLFSRGMLAVVAAQFLSAMADNALLFAALALLRLDRYPLWTEPLLQEFFVGAYILIAPFAGPFADAFPKGRVMLVSNGLKLAGALGMWMGLNPFLTYGLVGLGAAAYSPAKYGILSELVPSELLVKANGLLESSTIAAILSGAIAGGALADVSVKGALGVVTACYAAAAAANLLIPKLPPAHALGQWSPSAMMRDFIAAVRSMVKMEDTRFSMIGTSLFWGTGATMRFLLVAWVPVALAITTNRMPAYLNAMVAVGIVIGAGLASKFVSIGQGRSRAPGRRVDRCGRVPARPHHALAHRVPRHGTGRQLRRVLRRAVERAPARARSAKRGCRARHRGPESGRESLHARDDRSLYARRSRRRFHYRHRDALRPGTVSNHGHPLGASCPPPCRRTADRALKLFEGIDHATYFADYWSVHGGNPRQFC